MSRLYPEYFLITGLDEGEEIKPYVINTQQDDLYYHLESYGDSVRYCEKISKAEYLKMKQ